MITKFTTMISLSPPVSPWRTWLPLSLPPLFPFFPFHHFSFTSRYERVTDGVNWLWLVSDDGFVLPPYFALSLSPSLVFCSPTLHFPVGDDDAVAKEFVLQGRATRCEVRQDPTSLDEYQVIAMWVYKYIIIPSWHQADPVTEGKSSTQFMRRTLFLLPLQNVSSQLLDICVHYDYCCSW